MPIERLKDGCLRCEKCGEVFPKTFSHKLMLNGRLAYTVHNDSEVKACPRCGAKVVKNED